MIVSSYLRYQFGFRAISIRCIAMARNYCQQHNVNCEYDCYESHYLYKLFFMWCKYTKIFLQLGCKGMIKLLFKLSLCNYTMPLSFTMNQNLWIPADIIHCVNLLYLQEKMPFCKAKKHIDGIQQHLRKQKKSRS